jgi:hypothetical protein
VVHGVDAVGGDVHLEEVAVVWAEIVDTFYGDATEGEVFGELVIIGRDIGDVGAEPVGKDLHGLASLV